MRTCPKCGCYLPDNWITCPACFARYGAKSEPNDWVFEVNTCFWDGSLSTQYFKFYENALEYEQRQLERTEVVQSTSITKRKTKRKTIYE